MSEELEKVQEEQSSDFVVSVGYKEIMSGVNAGDANAVLLMGILIGKLGLDKEFDNELAEKVFAGKKAGISMKDGKPTYFIEDVEEEVNES